MTYQTSKYITIKDAFTSGMIDNDSAWAIPDANSPYLRNARRGNDGIEIRKGHKLFKQIAG
jgi:hypothetical protein